MRLVRKSYDRLSRHGSSRVLRHCPPSGPQYPSSRGQAQPRREQRKIAIKTGTLAARSPRLSAAFFCQASNDHRPRAHLLRNVGGSLTASVISTAGRSPRPDHTTRGRRRRIIPRPPTVCAHMHPLVEYPADAIGFDQPALWTQRRPSRFFSLRRLVSRVWKIRIPGPARLRTSKFVFPAFSLPLTSSGANVGRCSALKEIQLAVSGRPSPNRLLLCRVASAFGDTLLCVIFWMPSQVEGWTQEGPSMLGPSGQEIECDL